jgi:hypothetical protein
MHALEPGGKEIWLRVERAAKRAGSGIHTLFSKFPAKDTVSFIDNGPVASMVTPYFLSGNQIGYSVWL